MGLFERIRPRQLAFDVLVATTVLGFGLYGGLEIEGQTFSREPDLLNLLLIVLMTMPLVLRRVYPTAVFVVILAAWSLDRAFDYPVTLAVAGLIIAFYTIGVELPRRRSLRLGGISAAFLVIWTAIGTVTAESVPATSLVTTVISTVTPLLLGREIRERRRRVDEFKARAKRVEEERKEQARRAVADERVRIARELHDVVAHQMVVMTLQAEGARRVADGSDPRVVEALETISDAGHRALVEMRRMVGLLRATPEGRSETEPVPRLSDVRLLVEQMRAAGVGVDLSVAGDVRPLSDGVELSAYRIVQESLTNAVRHGGPGVTANVLIEYGDGELVVAVTDDGRGVAANTDSIGHGLVGMRERVSVVGGEFSAGPKAGGGFRVRASIPVES